MRYLKIFFLTIFIIFSLFPLITLADFAGKFGPECGDDDDSGDWSLCNQVRSMMEETQKFYSKYFSQKLNIGTAIFPNQPSGAILPFYSIGIGIGLPPLISSVKTKDITTDSVTITWSTVNSLSDSWVEYGPTTSYGTLIGNVDFVLYHFQTIKDLQPGTTYHFHVISQDIQKNISVSNDYTFETQSPDNYKFPQAITDLAVFSITPTSASLKWSTPQSSTGIINYDIKYNKSPINESNFSISSSVLSFPRGSAKTNNYTIVGLTSKTKYYFAVKAKDSRNNFSPLSNIVSATTQSLTMIDIEPPSQPFSVTANGIDGQIALSWKNPSDPDFVRTLIVRKENSEPQSVNDGFIIYDGTDEKNTDINLDRNKTYYYAIYSYDKIQNYSEPIIISIKPIPGESVSSQESFLTGPFKYGKKSNQTKLLQQILASDPDIYPEGLITGFYGPLTTKAVKKFQKKYKIYPINGKVGPKTLAKLNEVYKKEILTEKALIAELNKEILSLQEKIYDLLNQIKD